MEEEKILGFYIGDFDEQSSDFSSLKPNFEIELESWKSLFTEETIDEMKIMSLPEIEKINIKNRIKIGKDTFWETDEKTMEDFFFFRRNGGKLS